MIYEVGDLARVSVVFTDLSNNPADPTSVSLLVQSPDNTQNTYTPLHDSLGNYHHDLIISQSGTYFYRYTGTGAVQAVHEGQLTVQPTLLVPQPVPQSPPTFTFADLAAIDAAIKSGATEVRFQDRTVRYNSLDKLLIARTLIWNELYPSGSTNGPVRIVRIYTNKG
jgi:hypothetical protein